MMMNNHQHRSRVLPQPFAVLAMVLALLFFLLPARLQAHGEVEGGGAQNIVRTLEAPGGKYRVALMHSPAIPTAGEITNIEFTVTRILPEPDPLLGPEVPVGIQPEGLLLDSKSQRVLVPHLPVHPEGDAGIFGIAEYQFEHTGTLLLRFVIHSEVGDELTVDFPITVQSNMDAFFRFWVNLAVCLLILGLTGMQLWKVRATGGQIPQMVRPIAIGAASLVGVILVMNFFVLDQVLAMRKPKPSEVAEVAVTRNENGSYTISEPAQKELGIILVDVQQMPLQERISAFGAVEPDSQLVADIFAPFWGRIDFASAPLRVGDKVTKGQEVVLLSLELSAFERGLMLEKQKNLQGALVESQKRQDAAQVELDRAQKLASANPAYEQDLKWAKTLFDEAKKIHDEIAEQEKNYANAIKARDPRKTPITTPIAGQVTAIDFVPGQIGLTDEYLKLLTVTDTSFVWVWTQVQLHDAWKIKTGQVAQVFPADTTDNPLAGKVQYIDDAVDPANRTLRVLVRVPNANQRLALGSFARVEFSTQVRTIAVPEKAVVDEGSTKHVYVIREDGTFEPLLIEVGMKQDGWWQVISGLSEGDRVIGEGAGMLGSFRQQEVAGISH
ncbi:MAG: hypothetical protein A3F68_04320 [Acidobacteria bacterium RIFCSPLOWO2_12_FULL_54_10]|nr:MAG: hypothetical protein A3F68_04320 [Acidobacteria bacterium RIFCSPLOWO2_12_FULL_54_10]